MVFKAIIKIQRVGKCFYIDFFMLLVVKLYFLIINYTQASKTSFHLITQCANYMLLNELLDFINCYLWGSSNNQTFSYFCDFNDFSRCFHFPG